MLYVKDIQNTSGVGGLYTNPPVLKRKTVEVPQEPEFTQYMEEGTISKTDHNQLTIPTMKRAQSRKRPAYVRKTSVTGKKVKRSGVKPKKSQKSRSKLKQKTKKRTVIIHKDRF